MKAFPKIELKYLVYVLYRLSNFSGKHNYWSKFTEFIFQFHIHMAVVKLSDWFLVLVIIWFNSMKKVLFSFLAFLKLN